MVTVRTYFCQAEKTLLGGVSRTDILPSVCARGRERGRCRPAGCRILPTRVGSSPSWTRSCPRTAPAELGDGEGSRRALQHVGVDETAVARGHKIAFFKARSQTL